MTVRAVRRWFDNPSPATVLEDVTGCHGVTVAAEADTGSVVSTQVYDPTMRAVLGLLILAAIVVHYFWWIVALIAIVALTAGWVIETHAWPSSANGARRLRRVRTCSTGGRVLATSVVYDERGLYGAYPAVAV